MDNEYPESRQGHTTVSIDNYLIIFGGCKLDIKCFDELIYLDTR